MGGAPGLDRGERFPLEGQLKGMRVTLEEGGPSELSLPPGFGGLGDRWSRERREGMEVLQRVPAASPRPQAVCPAPAAPLS